MDSVDVDTMSPAIKLEPDELPLVDSFPAANDTTDDFTANDDEQESFHLVSWAYCMFCSLLYNAQPI